MAHLAAMVDSVGHEGDGEPAARELASRDAIAARSEVSGALSRFLVNGFKSLLQLESEFKQLKTALARRTDGDFLTSAYMPLLVEETYERGLSVLDDGLSIILASQRPGEERLEGEASELERELLALRTAGGGVDQERLRLKEQALSATQERLVMLKGRKEKATELLHQADLCVAALNRTRLELAGLKAEDSRARVDAAIASLRRATEESRAIQRELEQQLGQ